MIGKTNSQVGGGIKGEKVNISLLTNQPEHSALMGAAITVKHGGSETQYVWDGVGITVTIPSSEDYEVSVSGVAGYKTPEKFTATAQDNNARSLNFEYKAERVKVTLSAVGDADMNGTTVNVYGQEYTFSGTPIEVLVPFDEVYSVQGGAFGSLVAPSAQSFTASIPLREINLEYRSCVLVVNMLSNQVSDATIAALKASVMYGSTTIEVANGKMVDIPSGTDITVTFPEVENYNTPNPITFTSVNGINTQSATYVTERVIVNVSANDGASVEGQVVTVSRFVSREAPSGISIQDIKGNYWKTEDWDGSVQANAIAVVASDCRFLMALQDAYGSSCALGFNSKNISGVVTTSDLSTALKDFYGEDNTDKIIEQASGYTANGITGSPAAEYCRAFRFPDGSVGYLGAAGEWKTALNNKAAINAALAKCTSVVMSPSYWTSTQNNANGGWYIGWNGEAIVNLSKVSTSSVRAFAKIEETKILRSEVIVENGKVETYVSHNSEYTVSVNDKEGYKTPAPQSFTADSVSRNLSMVYEFSGLKLNINSNQPNDTSLAGVKATITYGGNSTELGNGEFLSLAESTEVTITFPEVENYKTPEPITFTHISGLSEKTGTYLTEKVTVNVSANDDGSVDGVTASVTRHKKVTLNPANGVYIQSVDGMLYTEAEWDGTKTPNGIAVVTDKCKFVAALNKLSEQHNWGPQVKINGVFTTTVPDEAKNDFAGLSNTQAIAGYSTDTAAQKCLDFVFPNGQTGYLMSAGEGQIWINYKDKINSALTKAGVGSNPYGGFLCSTQYDGSYAYEFSAGQPNSSGTSTSSDPNKYDKRYSTNIWPLTTLNLEITQPFPTEERITNGKAEFKVAHDTEYTVSVNDKEGYKTPALQTFIADSATRNVDMQYKVETVIVNVFSNDNNGVNGYEITVSKPSVTVGKSTKYTKLDYIESNGTQYIDTGFKPNSNTRMIIDMEPTSSATGFLFGSRANSSANDQSNSFSFVSISGTSLRSDFGSNESSINLSALQRLLIDKNKNVTTVNGESVSASEQSFSSSYNIYLLTVNTAGTPGAYIAAKIYSCQIYDNGSLVRDYVPALRSDGIAGLYDAVNDKFYPSNGTGNFVSGGEYKEVLGTQTSVTGTYKVPFGDSYSVVASDVSGYTTPAVQTFIAGQDSRVVDVYYQLSGLKLNILSNQANDTALADVKALVTYGSNSVELGNGETLGLSASTEVTITFPDVPDYKTPEPITFTHTSGYSEKTGTYLTEKVTVSVSANDGASVEGQVMTVTKMAKIGVYIQDIDGKLWKEDEWDNSVTPNGIAVLSNECKFIIGLDDISSDKQWGSTGTLVSNIVTTTDVNTASIDYNGKYNTDTIMGGYPANRAESCNICNSFTFPNGKKGYLGSAGEWTVAMANKEAILSALSKCGKSMSKDYYWSSTQYNISTAWASKWGAGGLGGFGKQTNTISTRAFGLLDGIESTINFQVISSPITFKAAHGTEYSVSVNDKTGYNTPASKSFTAQLTVNNVVMEYQKIVHSGTTTPTNGVWIQDTDGYCHLADEWTGEYTANGIAVVTSERSFVVALDNAGAAQKWGGYGTEVTDIVTSTSSNTAKNDYSGESNTTKIISQLSGKKDEQSVRGAPAAEAASSYTFPNGKKGYLPALGELGLVRSNLAAIQNALNKCGARVLAGAANNFYWSSTQYGSDESWTMNIDQSMIYYAYEKHKANWVRPFTSL